MADTYTAYYNLTKTEVGASRDTWGAKLNGNFDILDVAINAVSVTANAAMPKAGGTFTGAVTFNAGLTVAGAVATFNAGVTVGGAAATFNAGATVAGTLTAAIANFSGAATFGAAATFNAGLTASSLTMTGPLTLAGAAGGSAFSAGTGDGGTLATYNTRLKLWWGLGISSYDDVVRGVFDSRTGTWNTLGVPQVNGIPVWYPGNFDPNTKASINTDVTFHDVTADRGDGSGVIFLGNSGHYLYFNGADYVLSGAELKVGGGGSYVWHAGNINPARIGSTNTFTADQVIAKDNPALTLREATAGDLTMLADTYGNCMIYQAGDSKFYITPSGQIWTKQLGDLYTWIEQRASAYAATRANSEIGINQTWRDVKASRNNSTVYQNTTGKPIMIAISPGASSGTFPLKVSADNVNWVDIANLSGYFPAFAIIPNGHYYKMTGNSINMWAELY